MKLQRFEVESYMTLHENNCRYNLADTVAKSLTLKELLAYDKKDSLEDLMNLSLDYGAIEGSHELKKGILSLYQSGDDEEIAICHGGVNANELVLMTLLSTNDHILSFLPTYQQLYSFPESLGVEVDFIHLKEENEWKIDFEELEKNIRENTRMICLNLPNNPTGTTLDHEEMHQLIQICKKHDLYVLVDEIYRGLYQEESISDLYEKGIATSGLSKVLSTPGLRVGWIKTKDKELIRLINERRDYSIISSGPINDYLGALTLKYSKEILKRNREILEENKCENAVILFSGDTSFFSGAKKLKEEFPNAEIFAGISCVSYFCAKIGMAYDDMNIVSMHGRNCNIVSEVRENEKTFVLLGENPCDKLCRYGFENAEVYIGENLSYENEKILHGKAKGFRDTKLASLSVAVIINNEYDKCTKIGINDSEFVTGNAPMTKSEVRAVSISKLEIKYDDICYDIGAGTGSVSVEMALLCGKGKVYAIEKKAEAAELIKQNALKFHADNIEIICADAPNGMDGLPKADKVFIGGSSGNLYEIIEKCDCKKVVVNAITLETLSLAQESFEKLGYEYSVTQICASRGRKVGGYNMMTAQNPVFIICGEKL